MTKISYSDNLLFKNICINICNKIRDKKALNEVSERIYRYVTKLEKRANGYWHLPEGKVEFFKALKTIVVLLKNDATEAEIQSIYRKFTSFKNDINFKCCVTFLAQEYGVWPSLRGVYETMLQDSRFEVRVVYVPFRHNNATYKDDSLELYKEDGIPIIAYNEYSLTCDNPDIIFFAKPYYTIPFQYNAKEVTKIFDKTVYIAYGMEANYRLLYYGFHYYLQYIAWRHIVYGDYVKKVGTKYGYRNGENIVVWGHPKMDYFIKKNKKTLPIEWTQKISGRRVVCWCPHHTILPGDEHVSTWLNYNKIIFDWFDKHQDVVLLWRSHQLLFGALVNNGFMTQHQLDEFLQEKSRAGNIIIDCNSDYHYAFDISDAMITDCTTFSIEYLGTHKPLLLTTDDITQYYNYEEVRRCLYVAESSERVIEFLENFRNGRDYKKELRDEYIDKTVFYPKNKTISEYIKDKLLEDLISEQKDLAERLCK